MNRRVAPCLRLSALVFHVLLLVGVARGAAESVVWTDALALGVGGRPFEGNTGNLTYARWPAGAEADLNPGEWSYGLHSAGMFVQFFSDATAVHVKYAVRNTNLSVFRCGC